MRFILIHFRSAAYRREENLPIYALSFVPESPKVSEAGAPLLMECETSTAPRLAVEFSRLITDQPREETHLSIQTTPAAPAQSLTTLMT